MTPSISHLWHPLRKAASAPRCTRLARRVAETREVFGGIVSSRQTKRSDHDGSDGSEPSRPQLTIVFTLSLLLLGKVVTMSPFQEALIAYQQHRPFILGNPVEMQFPNIDVLDVAMDLDVRFSSNSFRVHNMVAGGSGGGKTRLLAGYVCDLIERRRGVTVVDSQKTLIGYIKAYVAKRWLETGDDQWLLRTHILDVSSTWSFNYQPLRIDVSNVPEEYVEMATLLRREVAGDRFIRSVLRTNTEEEKEMMRRLHKVIRKVVAAVATPSGNGEWLSPDDWDLVLDPYVDGHDEVYETIKDDLLQRVRRLFERLHLYRDQKRASEIDRVTESTDHALDETFTINVSTIFSRPDLPDFNLKRILLDAEENGLAPIILVDSSETDERSSESGQKIGGIVVDALSTAAQSIFEESGPIVHDLIIDEIGDLVTENVGRFLETQRKYGISITLAPQSLSTLRKGDKVDLAQPALNSMGSVMAFQCKDPESVQTLAPYFALPNRILVERKQVMDRPDPSLDEMITVTSRGLGGMRSVVQSHALGRHQMEAMNWQIHLARAIADGRADVQSRSIHALRNWAENESVASGRHWGSSTGEASGMAPIILDGIVIPMPSSSVHNGLMAGESDSRSSGASRGGARGRSEMRSVSFSHMLSQLFGIGVGVNEAMGESLVESHGNVDGNNWTTTVQEQLVQRSREYWDPTGQPRFAIPYQDAVYEHLLSTLPPRYAFLRTRMLGVDRTILFRVRDVPDVFGDWREERAAVSRFVEALYQSKPYMFHPEHPDRARARRLERFLAPPAADADNNPHSGGSELFR